MPQRIEYEGEVHEFPDDFTDADISAALKGHPTGRAAMTADQRQGTTARGYKAPAPTMAQTAADLRASMTSDNPVVNAAAAPFREMIAGPMEGAAQLGEVPGDVAGGRFARAMSNAVRGASKVAAPNAVPMLAGAVLTNPVAMAGTVAGGAGGGLLARGTAKALGANDDQAALAEDMGGLAGGTAGSVLADRLAQSLKAYGVPVSRWLMQKALKPGKADVPTEPGTDPLRGVREAVDSALNRNIPVSEAGLSKVGGRLEELQQQVQDIVDNATKAGKSVDPAAVARRLDELRVDAAGQALPAPDLRIIDQAKADFLAGHGAAPAVAPGPMKASGVLDASGRPIMTPGTPGRAATPPRPIEAREAQRIKQGTYGKTYGQGESSMVYKEAEKTLARGFKEELEAVAPELKGLNKEQEELFKLLPVLERRVRNESNSSILTPGETGTAVVGTVTGGPGVGVAMGAGKHFIDMPSIQSKVALILNRAATRAGKPVSMSTSMARAALVLGQLQQDQPEQ